MKVVAMCRFIDLLSYLFSANVGTLGTNTLSHGYGHSEVDLRGRPAWQPDVRTANKVRYNDIVKSTASRSSPDATTSPGKGPGRASSTVALSPMVQ